MGKEQAYYRRAIEFIAGARCGLREDRFNTATTLAYFAGFQAAVAARIITGDHRDRYQEWEHGRTKKRLDRLLRIWGETQLTGQLAKLAHARWPACYGSVGVSQRTAATSIAIAEEIMKCISGHEPGVISPQSSVSQPLTGL